jgi:alkanesulfonate monooxygenase SsuD/methylene tetrahydromethanopterin reductase-like flavin-dependent oxidoreductase (luciferase family)
MKIGIFALLSEKTIDPISAARRCEELGFESGWVPEHASINKFAVVRKSGGGVPPPERPEAAPTLVWYNHWPSCHRYGTYETRY